MRLRHSFHLALILLITILCFTSPGFGDESMLDHLVDQGIQVSDHVTVKLESPTHLDDLSTGSRDRLAGNFGWPRFTKKSVVAPVWIDLDYINNAAGERVGHSVRFRFVVHESVERLRDRDFLSSLFNGESETNHWTELKRSDLLSQDDQASHVAQASSEMTFGFATVPLMNRVLLRGVIAGQTVLDESGFVSAWRLVDTIDAANPYTARWSPLERDSLGKQVEGDASSYHGAGGYVNVQSLAPVDETFANVCLIEGQFVLHEPQAWFGSSNFLRSKFPLLIQEAARKFRRSLQKTK
ncbi:hypothetical protein CA13_54930 [Planctomycetes bacterium CA13]|uniref:Uncharacterized protein n=2 Tax=Novipirellula herctigrandis TaxID=2527986 RepID=A0A5C5Z9H6_9BACT|nr:hypothetical protein CA13_54930 [Planctomycetes bacterium CA13]